MYSQLGLSQNPFVSIPPIGSYEPDFRSMFSARNLEVEKLCRYASSARATFLIASFGGGKTVVLLEALSRLRAAGAATVYASFERDKGFRKCLAEAMTAAQLPMEKAKHDPHRAIRLAIRNVRSTGKKVVLAVDDLDRAGDIAEVWEVTNDVRDILSDGAAIIVTGQPFGVTSDLHTSAGGVFHEIAIPDFSRADFAEMLGKYLQVAHMRPDLPPLHPFDQSGAEFVCREMSTARMTPRLFNFAVSSLIENAVDAKQSEIPFETVLEFWPSLAKSVVSSLTGLQRMHLEVILEETRVSEDSHDAIAKLGGDILAEFPEVRDGVLRPLVEKNILQIRKEDGKDVYLPTPHAATAIQDFVGYPLDSEIREMLLRKWNECLSETNAQKKGECLERFVAEFMHQIPGFHVPADGLRLRTEVEELDVVVEVRGGEHHTRYGSLFVCECKNWKDAVPGGALSDFRDKLKKRQCRFGVVVAVNGVLPAFRDKIRECLKEGIVIALLTAQEFSPLEHGEHPASILANAYYATLKYTGERPHAS